MFLATITTIENPLDFIKLLAEPGLIYCLFGIFTALFFQYSLKTQKYKKLALALAAILFVISFIVYLRAK